MKAKLKLIALLMMVSSINTYSQYKSEPIIICGYLNSGGTEPDSLELQIKKEFGRQSTVQPKKILKTIANNGQFKFTLEKTSKPFYISLRSLTKDGKFIPFSWDIHLLDRYLVEPGDSVYIHFDEQKKAVLFSGNGSEKFKWRYNTLNFRDKFRNTPPFLAYAAVSLFPLTDLITNYNLASLDSIRSEVSPATHTILKAEALDRISACYSELVTHNFYKHLKDSLITANVITAYEKKLLNYPIDTVEQLSKAYSATYALLMLNKARARFAYNRFKNLPNAKDEYSLIKDSYPIGKLRDKTIMSYIYTKIADSKITDSLLNDAIKEVSNASYSNELHELLDVYGIGKPVKDFNFIDKDGKNVQLSDFKGKVILVDMWFTGCSGCIDVAKNLPAVEKAFEHNSKVVFLSLAIDRDKESWLRSIDPKKMVNNSYTHYTTPTTKYVYTGGQKDNHPFIKKYNPTGSYPHLLLIDKKGQIFSSDPPKPYDQKGQDQLISLIKKALL